jgi:hypothetical protein
MEDITTTLRELDHRFNDGIDVRLLWRPEDDRTLVSVWDTKTALAFTVEVDRDERALDAFHHPFAYAAAGTAAPAPVIQPA